MQSPRHTNPASSPVRFQAVTNRYAPPLEERAAWTALIDERELQDAISQGGGGREDDRSPSPNGATEHASPPAQGFSEQVPQRLTRMRLQLCGLTRAQGAAKQQISLAGFSMQCQWLAGCARMAHFHAASQVASALEALTKELHDCPAQINDSSLRTLAFAIDLLTALATCDPSNAGRAEGARILVVDPEISTRVRTLSALERYGVTAIGIATPDTALSLMDENSLDVIVVRAEMTGKNASEFCQAIRSKTRQQRTPILVLTSQADWETRALYAMSGATEILCEPFLNPELALKVLGHFFRGRLSGANA